MHPTLAIIKQGVREKSSLYSCRNYLLLTEDRSFASELGGEVRRCLDRDGRIHVGPAIPLVVNATPTNPRVPPTAISRAPAFTPLLRRTARR